MTNRFEGRRVAVIGATGGIGLAICESLAGQGAQVRCVAQPGPGPSPAPASGYAWSGLRTLWQP